MNSIEIFHSLQKIIQEHRKTFDENNPRDVIDKYFIEIEKNKSDPNTIFTKDCE